MAFDIYGGRLGNGKGYYDSFLKEIKGRIPLFGIAFDCQIRSENLPFDYHDVSMDQVITESGLLLKKEDWKIRKPGIVLCLSMFFWARLSYSSCFLSCTHFPFFVCVQFKRVSSLESALVKMHWLHPWVLCGFLDLKKKFLDIRLFGRFVVYSRHLDKEQIGPGP